MMGPRNVPFEIACGDTSIQVCAGIWTLILVLHT